ncbi:MAG: TolC family protein, partial [Victivallales bacterium]|nr:TolC family protein [Victivallales bacterium]
AVPLSDVLNFKIKVNQADSSQISAEYSFNAYRYILAGLMGITEATLPESLKYSPIDSVPGETLPDINIYLDMALNNRPDLRQYRETLQAARYQLYSSWGAYSPTVSLSGGLGYGTNLTRYEARNGNVTPAHTYYNDRNYNWGVDAQWVIFNGFSRELQIRQAQSNVYVAEFNVASQWITVIQEVRTAYDTYLQNVKQAKLYKETLTLVTKQRDLVEEEYKAGNKELTRLNEAQNELTSAEANLVMALVNVMNAKAQLEAATNSNQLGADARE